jgi:hypothetical protein
MSGGPRSSPGDNTMINISGTGHLSAFTLHIGDLVVSDEISCGTFLSLCSLDKLSHKSETRFICGISIKLHRQALKRHTNTSLTL